MKKLFITALIGLFFFTISPLATAKILADTEQETTVINIVKDAYPSVVTIEIEKTKTNANQPEGFNLFNSFNSFIRLFTQSSPNGQQSEQKYNIGSGFVVSSNGIIVTNKHVVSDQSASYNVVSNDNKKYKVTKIYRDPANEIAILKINASNLKAVKMGDSDKIQIGEGAIAMGTVLGDLENTVTSGIISGKNRTISVDNPSGKKDELKNMIQTDAAVNLGNSGGPLFNTSGEVIGVNTVTTLFGENIGFALPINLVKKDVDNYKQKEGL
ncbi:hypothetical protein C4559_02515 [Candidatus Microgenomates bacterium]|nr:MAG: hypothetical protein C4559_02515 [Candidatus Microgenomates bacterium]